MEKIRMPRDEFLKSLIKLGTRGYFPLFESSWINQVEKSKPKKLTKQEKLRAKRILKRLEQHKCLDRKKIVVLSLLNEERDVLIKTFLKLVEGEILDQKPELQ